MKNAWGLRVVIRKDKMKDGGRCPLHWEATVNGEVRKFSTGKVVEQKYWDNQKKEAKKGCGYSMVLNGYLRKTFNDYEEYMIGLENKGIPLSKKKVEVFFRGEKKVTFYGFFERTVKMWEGDKRPSTLNSYLNTLKIMKLMDSDVDFGDIDYEFINKWDYFLKTERRNKVNGRFNRHKCLKAIIKEAMLQGYMTKTPYLHFKIKKQESKREFLPIEEVKELMELELPTKHIRLQRTKDMFLFCCFTGLRYSDVVRLKWANIEMSADGTIGLLTIEMLKTSKEVKTTLIPPAIEIINRYKRNSDDEPIFDYITNAAVNRNMHVLMRLVGINKRITFHCSRHSFASNHLEVDTPVEKLKDLLGHSDISQTQIYAKNLSQGLVDSMNNLGNAYS